MVCLSRAHHLQRTGERRPDIRAVEHGGVIRDPVEIKENAVDVAGEIGQHERRSGETDQSDAIDGLGLPPEEVLDLREGTFGARRAHVTRLHRHGSVENENQILTLELRRAALEEYLRAHQRRAREEPRTEAARTRTTASRRHVLRRDSERNRG